MNRAGFQAVVAWQLVQLAAPTGIWVPVFPDAVRPSWQLAQFVAALNVLWSGLAEFQFDVDLWQVSHAAWVGMCPGDLPLATAPL
ncbi:MAG: hypothetical protein CVU30_01965 [Betaproteobacteria bacterium HGW-Betaproteobacteria-3]|nr:MAG: hypothetical protein CVU30_01965 [Betaproteobacteria bacterium HGW-Betaproteobacteria-3]